LIFHGTRQTIKRMSVAKLVKSIARLTPEQQAVVMRFVEKVRRSNSPAHRRKLAKINRDMDAGKKFTQAQVDAALMCSVLGRVQNFQPGKSSRQILTELRGYDRDAL
jgi:hypothetical protein